MKWPVLVVMWSLALSAGVMGMTKTSLEASPSQSTSDDAKTIDEAKKRKELFEAQKAAAEAEKQFLDAQKALEDAKGPISATEEGTAQQLARARAAKELADAQKALADSQKAQSDAQLAAIKAAIGEVPSSGISGTVTTGDKSGEIEAVLLAMRAVQEAGTEIGTLIRKVLGANPKVVIVAASETPTFANLMAYGAELAIINKVLDAAASAVKTSEESTEAVPILGAAGLALDATSKLLSFFRTDYVTQGVTVAIEDRVAVDEVANALVLLGVQVKAPLIYDAAAVSGAVQFFVDDATRLSEKRAKLGPALAKSSRQIAELTKQLAAPNLPSETKSSLETALTGQTALSTSLKNATALVDAWYTKLGAADAKGVATIVNVAREKSIADTLAADADLLVVKMQKAGGNFMTKKNLWTLFGGMPLYHMGGAAVSFTLIDGKQSQIKASGVVPIHGGFVKAGDVREELRKP